MFAQLAEKEKGGETVRAKVPGRNARSASEAHEAWSMVVHVLNSHCAQMPNACTHHIPDMVQENAEDRDRSESMRTIFVNQIRRVREQ